MAAEPIPEQTAHTRFRVKSLIQFLLDMGCFDGIRVRWEKNPVVRCLVLEYKLPDYSTPAVLTQETMARFFEQLQIQTVLTPHPYLEFVLSGDDTSPTDNRNTNVGRVFEALTTPVGHALKPSLYILKPHPMTMLQDRRNREQIHQQHLGLARAALPTDAIRGLAVDPNGRIVHFNDQRMFFTMPPKQLQPDIHLDAAFGAGVVTLQGAAGDLVYHNRQ